MQSPAPQASELPDPTLENALVVPKQTLGVFVVTEFFVYLSQVLMFFFVAVLASNLLRDEEHLVAYLNSKVNAGTLYEVVATMIAIAATVGIIAGITKAVPRSSVLERVADEVLAEAPRTAYIFGSGVTGTMFAVSLYLRSHPQGQGPQAAYVASIALLWALVGFLYGCLFSYAFKHKAYIKTSSTSTSANAP